MNSKSTHMEAKARTTWIYICFNLLFITRACYGSLLLWPKNTTAVEGDRVVLPCQTDVLGYTIFWKFNESEIFYGGRVSLQYASDFRVDEIDSQGVYNLIIPIATKWYAGVYTCTDDEGEGEKRSAWLTVTDPPTIVAIDETGSPSETNTIALVCIALGITLLVFAAIGIVIGLHCYHKKQRERNEEKCPKSQTLMLINKDQTSTHNDKRGEVDETPFDFEKSRSVFEDQTPIKDKRQLDKSIDGFIEDDFEQNSVRSEESVRGWRETTSVKSYI